VDVNSLLSPFPQEANTYQSGFVLAVPMSSGDLSQTIPGQRTIGSFELAGKYAIVLFQLP
jgi:hypothetical protein